MLSHGPGPQPHLGEPLALRATLYAGLDAAARNWLDQALTEAARPARTDASRTAPSHVPTWERAFAAAGRRCRTATLDTGHGADPADLARVLLLHAAQPTAATVTRLYQQGTAVERRAVLYALPWLDLGPAARPLVEDALRTNDTRLVAAAVGPAAAELLPAHAWRHALLKCLFTGVPIGYVAGLRQRAHGDGELARMLTDYAHERTAAGRTVPLDLHHLLDLCDAATDAPPSGFGQPPTEES